MIFKKKVFLKEIDSTSDYLIRLDNTINLDEGFVVSSDFQKKGRGRMGRRWYSDCEKNLLFSFILKPSFLPLKKQFFLSMISSIAIFQTLEKYISQKISVKWPNDILVNNKKIAGFLLDLSISSGHIKRCVVGCGLNINQEKFTHLDNVTSMRALNNKIIDKKIILDHFLNNVSKLYIDLKNGEIDTIINRYLSLTKDFTFTTVINNKKSEIQILNVSEEGDVLALVDGVIQNLKNIF